jgi:hypothetical protein
MVVQSKPTGRTIALGDRHEALGVRSEVFRFRLSCEQMLVFIVPPKAHNLKFSSQIFKI